MSVSGGGATQTTIAGLIPSTTYSIEVAAVNSAGTGDYSIPPVTVEIPQGKTIIFFPRLYTNIVNVYMYNTSIMHALAGSSFFGMLTLQVYFSV